MSKKNWIRRTRILLVLLTLGFSTGAKAEAPKTWDAGTVATQARLRGDAKRGALVFFKSAAACAKCHASGKNASPLGPPLETIAKDVSDQYIAEAILEPSKIIRQGFETVRVLTVDGKLATGLVADESKEHLVLRDAQNLEQEIRIARDDIDEIIVDKTSMMPANLVASLPQERDLYDLVRYVMEVARGGSERAAQLRPDPKALIVADDTVNLDHAGILRRLNKKDVAAGQRIYQGHCKNCHGTDGNTPTLATARAFGKQRLKYGADPYKMLLTLTKGAGLMTPMQHLSPKQRYQVVYYIREALMKPSNPDYAPVDEDYLAGLPTGTSQGEFATADQRDYGPVLGSQIGSAVNNALTFRLADDVAVSYDLHRMRLAGAWKGGFLDLSETHHYRQRGERMPQIAGERLPGLSDWQWAFDGSFELPADAKPPRGPVREDWLQYKGHYLYGDQAVLRYAVQGREVLESIESLRVDGRIVLQHTLRIEPGEQALKLAVARLPDSQGPAGLIAPGQTLGQTRSGPAANRVALLRGPIPKAADRPKSANKPRHVVSGKAADKLDLGTPKRTVLVRFRTTGNGTLIASAPAQGRWQPNGKTLFVRGKRLVFDIGWVGAMVGKSAVADGQWHVAALVVGPDTTKLYVDGKLEAQRPQFRRDTESGHVLKIGATATNFGGDFDGEIDWIRILGQEMSSEDLATTSQAVEPPPGDALFTWKPKLATKSPGHAREPSSALVAAATHGDVEGATWSFDDAGRIVLSIPASQRPRVLAVSRCSTQGAALESLVETLRSVSSSEVADPQEKTRGGPLRWPQRLEVRGTLGEPINGYALDSIEVPFDNPWNAWMRTSALDFFADGRAVVTTHGGDVYLVHGIDDKLQRVVWKRFAAGLFEPFGVRVVDETIYVTCRDGIKRLHDYNQDGEADFVEAFWIDDDVSSMFHAYNFDLQTDSQGNFYFAKAGQYTRHHRPGTIMRIPPEGGRAEVVAWGLRTPNGMGKLHDDRFTVSDNQGPWMPAGKISLIEQGSFLGNMPINNEQKSWLQARHGGKLPEDFDEPMLWLPQELDNSCGGQTWVDDRRFGPLAGRLIHSSFGKGWLYYLSLQEIKGKTQASIVALPHQWDAGVMRLRTNPADGQLYGTGLSGWQGPRGGKDGCLQRLRYTGEPARIIESTRVVPAGLELRFNFAVDSKTASDPSAWQCQMWDYLWSRRYGSDQFSVLEAGKKGRDTLPIKEVQLVNPKTVRLIIPNLRVCDQLSLKMDFADAAGNRFIEHLYATIHGLGEPGK